MDDNKEEKVLFKVSCVPLVGDEETKVTNVETHISGYDDIFEVCYAIHKLFKSIPEAKGLVEIFEVEPIDRYLEENSLRVPDFNELLNRGTNSNTK